MSGASALLESCRGCARTELYLFLRLGPHPLANGFLREAQLSEPEPVFDLDAYVCLSCGLIQIPDHVPAQFFRNYVYVPSASDEMRAHFDALAETVCRHWLPAGRGLTVDIGCNDATFLKCLSRRGARTLGIDPATNIVELARLEGVEIVNEYFDPDVARRVADEHGRAAVVVTTNTFHHIGDLDRFTEAVTILLDDDGVFVIELPHALEIVRTNQFDGIYHEHVSQFTVRSVADHAARFGLSVVRIDGLPVHGGSIRAFLKRSPGGVNGVLAPWVEAERKAGLLDRRTYDRFRQRVGAIGRDLPALLCDLKRAGRRIAAYGASARGNTVLNYCGIGTDLLECIVDRNELKHGLYTPGMHVPVRPVSALEADPPDDLLVLAWNFADEVMRQQAGFRSRGGRFVLPLPEPRIVS